MKILTIGLILFSLNTFAATQTWLIGGNQNEFEVVLPIGFLISKSCAADLQSCQAGRKAGLPHPNRVIERGGKNPGSRGCMEVGGSVVMGRNLDEASQAFCVFKDGSIGSLNAY